MHGHFYFNHIRNGERNLCTVRNILAKRLYRNHSTPQIIGHLGRHA